MSHMINSNFFPFIPSGPFHNVNISCAYQPRFLSQSNQRQNDHVSFSVSERSLKAAARTPLNVEIGWLYFEQANSDGDKIRKVTD